MKERSALLYLSAFTASLLFIHFALSYAFNSTYPKFLTFSYLLIYSISFFEILSLRVRNTTYSNTVPYVVLGMSLLKMLISILWIFFAISKGWIPTGAVMVHFFVPYFLMLAITSLLMIRILR
ncbi:MAG: hypothetical protein ACK4EX_01665 [Thermaurantimonas sp.]|uniref:hypothetical protein n=1 Tax=Thermaurantimonas sp. TaxID=2681568 RepID=UPI00391BCAA9